MRGIFGIAAVREAAHQFAEGFEGFAGALGVALGQVLIGQPAQQPEVFVEGGQPFQVVGVIDMRMVRVQADEAFGRSNRQRRLVRLVMRVGNLDLRLLGKTAIRVTCLKALIELDCPVIGAGVERILGFGIDALGAPAGGFVDLFGQQAATAQQKDADNR